MNMGCFAMVRARKRWQWPWRRGGGGPSARPSRGGGDSHARAWHYRGQSEREGSSRRGSAFATCPCSHPHILRDFAQRAVCSVGKYKPLLVHTMALRSQAGRPPFGEDCPRIVNQLPSRGPREFRRCDQHIALIKNSKMLHQGQEVIEWAQHCCQCNQ